MNPGDTFYTAWVDDWKVWIRSHKCKEYKPIAGYVVTEEIMIVWLLTAWGRTEKEAKIKLLMQHRSHADMVLKSLLENP